MPNPLHTLIICNGEPPSRKLCRGYARECGLIIAADGGANTARRHGIRPDVIIGDFDSITPATKRYFRATRFIHIARQDSTDLEKALSFAQRKGTEVTIVGATGRRIDFTLGNLSVLWNYTHRLAITVAGDGWQARPIVGRIDLRVRKGATISLVPFGPCSGITLKGFRFPLRNARMKVGEIGVSNVATASRISVVVKRGKMLLLSIEKASKS
jgi:thiamine pyrophosphokinase